MKKPGLRSGGRKRASRLLRFIRTVVVHTPIVQMMFLLVFLWLVFSAAFYLAESKVEQTSIESYGDALYWSVAAFSTAGIADTPKSDIAQLVGAIWIVVGSVLFFGTIVATVTAYFMRPMQRPAKRIVDTIEYNLEQLDDLSIEELDLLKDTVDTLITHVEELKERRAK
ncbi:MAG: two pore domain potassium channel family protein [Gammaproteobacteria bacterium]|nr:two pore domain potassium channel family protein [Gammaproteobacteria bacterium]NIM75007.1 two pore domain potassium channel family protein [Gammaproteobacteria bacterium]NIN38478.1 two pore domain potassium channel family protein [Gammaproteobacteria bacterium]NIO23858.1 two pore domain potassium channel family protein [Gammaproteobacteria bacterium]NIO64500.1 two pore domain potassium channel family protein [Gammaproteobacteria bacterium]